MERLHQMMVEFILEAQTMWIRSFTTVEDKSILIYCKISSLSHSLSLSFFSLVFFPLSRARSKGLNWSCFSLSAELKLTKLPFPSLVSQEAKHQMHTRLAHFLCCTYDVWAYSLGAFTLLNSHPRGWFPKQHNARQAQSKQPFNAGMTCHAICLLAYGFDLHNHCIRK